MIKILSLLLLLFSCSSEPKGGLKVAASSMPHAQMLEAIKPDLQREGVNLIIIVTDDYNTPNRSLADGEIDANFFQHLPFLEDQVKQFHYPIESLAKIEIEPMGVYSQKIHSLSELKENAAVAVPNDPTNEARALLLLAKQGVIQLDNPDNLHATILNIVKNPKNLKFIEVDAAMLPRTLSDVEAAVINTNYALQANLPAPLVLEGSDSPYVNIIAIRKGDEGRPEIIALKRAMTSEKMKDFIEKTYHGAVVPAF